MHKPSPPPPLLDPLEPRLLLAAVPPGFTDAQVASGLDSPTTMAFAPSENGVTRLFVAEQGGALRVVKNGALQPAPFVTLPVDSRGERGLLGVALDPNYAANHFVYVYYTATSPTPHNRVSRFVATGDTAAGGLAGETVLLDLDPLSSATNHNGGALNFGLDGKLYVAVGDNANGANAQSLATLKGKLLRLNPDGTIPADNPFYTTATGDNRAIWSLGLRNPYSFAVDPRFGTIYVNDVGQNSWEEINLAFGGANFGWPQTEGDFNPAAFPDYRRPVYQYDHANGQIAITGGAFYRATPSAFPQTYVGSYFFADFGAGWIRRLDTATGAVSDFATGAQGPVSLQVGPDGALYYLEFQSGDLRRVTFPASSTAAFAAPAIPSDFIARLDKDVNAPHLFSLTYDPAVDVASLAQPGAVRVLDRHGFVPGNATLVAIDPATRTSTWEIIHPQGWGIGRYEISTPTGVIKDTNGAFLAGRVIGDFYVDSDAYFRQRYYDAANPDVAAAVASGQFVHSSSHFNFSGAEEGRSPSPLFDEAWYRAQYPDVAAAIARATPGDPRSGFLHFIRSGHKENRAPNPFFDAAFYLARYPDAAAFVAANPDRPAYEYFLTTGAPRGHAPAPFFDPAFYLATHPALAGGAAAGTARSPFEAFILLGLPRGDAPTPFYRESDYLAFNPDIAAAVANGQVPSGLVHFIRSGQREGRRASVFFDPSYYRAQNPDVATALAAGALPSAHAHYLASGAREARLAHPLFNAAHYLSNNPDVAAALAAGTMPSALYHFAAAGARERRNPSPTFDTAFYVQNHPAVATALANGLFASPFEHYILVGQTLGLNTHA